MRGLGEVGCVCAAEVRVRLYGGYVHMRTCGAVCEHAICRLKQRHLRHVLFFWRINLWVAEHGGGQSDFGGS